jgi:hypothetical protein
LRLFISDLLLDERYWAVLLFLRKKIDDDDTGLHVFMELKKKFNSTCGCRVHGAQKRFNSI